jgi:hypothetical protein
VRAKPGGLCGKFSATPRTKIIFEAFGGMRRTAEISQRRYRAMNFIWILCNADIPRLAVAAENLIFRRVLAGQLACKFSRDSKLSAVSLKSP